MDILEEELKTEIGKDLSFMIVETNWASISRNCFDNGILQIPSQTINWLEPVIKINNICSSDLAINFVIFPYSDGGWAAQCVPPSLDEKFNQRISFPSSWAGQTDRLPEISGVKDALFCHNGCFFARASSKESIIEMCFLATESFR